MRSKFKWIFTLIAALTMQFSFAQEKTITGVVSDAGGPLPGVNVVVKGTQRGVSTGFDGSYSIKAKEGETLVYSFMGMRDVSKVVGASTVINTLMQDDAKQLGEVVVTGAMGIKKKGDAQTSSQQLVKSKELTQAANPNVIQSLTAKVSGLQINTTSNGVTPQTRIVLRGLRTITGNSEALVVIDGSISSANVLTQLPPEMVESVNIIKGQQGAALYGDQGSNGVLIVTTKRGSKNAKMQIGINSSIDFEQVAFIPKRQMKYGQGWATDTAFDDGTGLQGTHVPFENGGWGPAFDDPNFAGTLQATGLPQADGNFLMLPWAPIKDNIKEFFKTGTLLQNGISLNAGNEDGYAAFSYNRQNTDFVVEGDKLVRNSFLFKGGKKINKWNLDGSVNYTSQQAKQTDAGLYDDLMQTASNIPVEKFGQLGGKNEHHWTVYYKSPYWKSENMRYTAGSDILNATVNLGYQINKNISINYSPNIQLRNTKNEYYNNGYNLDYEYSFAAPFTYGGNSNYHYSDLTVTPTIESSYYNQNEYRRNIFSNLLINFDYNLTEKLGLKFNLGTDAQDRFFSVITNGGTGLDKEGIYNVNNIINNGNVINNNSDSDTPFDFIGVGNKLFNKQDRYRKVGVYGNADFSYEDYLFLNMTARYEKASTVNNSQFYPGVGVSFVPTKAFDFLKDNSVLNYLKLNASYVKTGNASAVNPTETAAFGGVPGTGFPFGTLNSFRFDTSQIDPNIRPEFVTTMEFGASIGLFNDRITLEGSIYQSDTNDLITNQTASRPSGLTSLKSNIGDLRNKGFEVDLGLIPVRNDNFTWSMKGSFTTNKTTVTSLAAGVDQISLINNAFVGIFAEVGEEFPIIKGTKFERDPSGNIIVGADGRPLRTSTYEKLGKSTPDYIIGFTNSFDYKGLKLTAVLDYRTGHSIYSDTMRNLAWSGHLEDSADGDRNNGYLVPNSVQLIGGNYVPNQTTAGGTTDALGNPTSNGGYEGLYHYYDDIVSRTGETTVIDATALKIREISLSYNLPGKMIEKIGLSSLRFGVNARNPFVFLAKENKGYSDPEASITSGGGFNNNALGWANIGQYPTTKTYGFSVNLSF